jgi:hypothetical protein
MSVLSVRNFYAVTLCLLSFLVILAERISVFLVCFLISSVFVLCYWFLLLIISRLLTLFSLFLIFLDSWSGNVSSSTLSQTHSTFAALAFCTSSNSTKISMLCLCISLPFKTVEILFPWGFFFGSWVQLVEEFKLHHLPIVLVHVFWSFVLGAVIFLDKLVLSLLRGVSLHPCDFLCSEVDFV